MKKPSFLWFPVQVAFLIAVGLLFAAVFAKSWFPRRSEAPKEAVAIAEGRDLILNHRFLPRDFHQDTFDDLWQDWPEPLRSKAKSATPHQRRLMAFERYGFTPRSNDPQKPIQFSVDNEGWWAMNCFTCHGGKVGGEFVEGSPNTHIALETMYADLRRTKKRRGDPYSPMDLGSLAVPMGTSNGTSNAVIFGIGLMTFRDKDLNHTFRIRPHLITHHDMDAPAWWNISKRERLYIDGFVEKSPRALVPFVMDQMNTGAQMRGWEDEFETIFEFIESIQPPGYPHPIDNEMAKIGAGIFSKQCASCHGTYGVPSTYPSRIVSIDKIGTDPVRLNALTKYDRQVYHESWFAHHGADTTEIDPIGYQAPPLDGIWASAPYFHNGSVPTVEGVLNSESRPVVWRRSEDGYDQVNVGLDVMKFSEFPSHITRRDEQRKYFDTTRFGKSAGGHTFGDKLSFKQRKQLIEYLKTL